jgi:hypothetical protein
MDFFILYTRWAREFLHVRREPKTFENHWSKVMFMHL